MNLVVSLHDVHPSSLEVVAKQRAQLRSLGVRRISLLVVPQWHGAEALESDAEFTKTISQWQNEGDEIVLHGWTHSCRGLPQRARDWFWTRLYTSQEAEFLLADPAETRRRLTAGRELFDRFGWVSVGFIAPAWLLAPHTLAILKELGFAYTVTRKLLLPLGNTMSPRASTSLCYSTRSGWRRGVSRLWNPALLRSLRRSPNLRISLHPGDFTYPAVWDQICRLTQSAVAAGRITLAYRDCVPVHSQARVSLPNLPPSV